MKKLTIGVPVYNAEPYLVRCLDSLLRQNVDSKNYEILCIDDGSTDESWNILCKYKQLYPDIFTLLQNEKNIGLANTRNRLINNAKGEYIGFVDADDYVIDRAFSFLCDFLQEDIDVLQFSMITLDNNVLKNNLAKTECEGTIQYDGPAKVFLERWLPLFISALFIRVSYLQKHDLQLLDTRYCEDPLFILRLYMSNPRLRYVDSDVYRYTVNSSQMSRERDPQKMKIAVHSYMTFIEYLVKYRDECTNEESNLRNSLVRITTNQMNPFISRALCANLSRVQFGDLQKTLKRWNVLPIKGDVYSKVINISLSSFFIFSIVSVFYKKIFVPYILVRLNRN